MDTISIKKTCRTQSDGHYFHKKNHANVCLDMHQFYKFQNLTVQTFELRQEFQGAKCGPTGGCGSSMGFHFYPYNGPQFASIWGRFGLLKWLQNRSQNAPDTRSDARNQKL